MDVRASLNSEGNLSVVTGDGQQPFTEDSFFAKVPPQAASTVGRSKARRYLQDSEGGSFIEGIPNRRTPTLPDDPGCQEILFGAPDLLSASGRIPTAATSDRDDWSVVKDWCRENSNKERDHDEKSSLGILNVDDMDLSSTNLLLECPMEDLLKRHTGDCPDIISEKHQLYGMEQYSKNPQQFNSISQGGSGYEQGKSTPQHSGSTFQHHSSTLQNSGSSLQTSGSQLQNSGTLLQRSGNSLQGSGNGSQQFGNSGSLQFSGSHQMSSDSNNSQDSKPYQPFARSQLGTVKKNNNGPPKKDPIATAIKQSLFGEIGEEREDGDVSVYNVEFGEDELQELDMDFGEMNTSDGADSDAEEASTPTNKAAQTVEIDSMYLRPGLMGEEQQTTLKTTLPCLSKVSLFDGGSGSEIDTEDELELARQAQGTRHEAAGQASQEILRPGLVGSDDDRQPPITQRQSAEGDVVSSPVPGDGGGGGDGSSGSDSEDGRRSNLTNHSHNGFSRSRMTNQAQMVDQEQRIKPMGDDLLSEMRFRPYNSVGNQDEGDSHILSCYLTPSAPADSTNETGGQFNLEDFLSSQHQQQDLDEEEGDLEFDPGNRLEASGFNADDFSALIGDKSSNPFDLKASSFGSWGGNTPEPDAASPAAEDFTSHRPATTAGSDYSLKQDRLSGEDKWCELEGSLRTSHGSGGTQSRTSPAHIEDWNRSSGSLGIRSQGPGSPARSSSGKSDYSSLHKDPHTGHVKGQGQSRPVPPLNDVDVFKKPAIPVLKSAGKFNKSVAKTKQRLSSANSSYSSNGSSGGASTRSAGSTRSGGLGENELAFRMSLTQEAEEQRHCLKRVPSIGGTSELDLTVPDDEFFGSANARAMLDADEVEFQKENIISEVDAMTDQGNASDDSWQYRSVMSVARPSWLENQNEEEEVLVRISVGSYMRSGTGSLGALDGHGQERPDFGLACSSPPKTNSGLRDIEENTMEELRTSGVGQYGSGPPARTPARTPARLPSEEIHDDTLTMESLENTPAKDKTLSKTLDVGNSTKLSMGELSILLKKCGDPKGNIDNLLSVMSQKSRSHHKENLNPMSQKMVVSSENSSSTSSDHNTFSTKTSSRPALQVSNVANTNNTHLTRSFPKVNEAQYLGLSQSKKDGEICSKSDTLLTNKARYIIDNQGKDDVSNENKYSAPDSPKKSDENEMPEEFFSPNASTYGASTSGIIDRLAEFKFGEGEPSKDDENQRRQYKDRDSCQRNLMLDIGLDDRETAAAPDGEDRLTSQHQSHLQRDSNIQRDSQKQRDERYKVLSAHRHIEPSCTQPTIHNTLNTANKEALEMCKLSNTSSSSITMDHGYMPGHHIPDGTEYSQRSDYAHINHRGMVREDVAGVEDVDLAESRGFDMLQRPQENTAGNHYRKMSLKDKTMPISCSGTDRDMSLQSTKSAYSHGGPMMKATYEEMYRQREEDRRAYTANVDCDKIDSRSQPSHGLHQKGLQGNIPHNYTTDSNKYSLPTESHAVSDKSLNPPSLNSGVNSQSSSINHDKPYLLTKHSLMQTDFAKENLQRNFNRETMDKIYSRSSMSGVFCEMDIEDNTMLQQHDLSTLSQSGSNNSQFKVPDSNMSHLQSLKLNHSVVSDRNQKPSNTAATPARSTVCPVEAPGVLKFEACCVGIARGHKLPLRNPTEKYMECSLQVLALEIEGQSVMTSSNNSPFELRRKRVVISPKQLAHVDVMFVPKVPGTHIAKLEILSNTFRKEGENRQSSLPVIVTLLAIAEEPLIKVCCDDKETDCVDFGEMVWGSCQEKTLSLRNMRQATVPLRVVISSVNTWHCFSFEPESRMSDVSVISGQQRSLTGHGKSIVNLSIPGCQDPFSTHEVKIWCRPPEKHLPRTKCIQPPEQFTCRVDIEVDIPYSKYPKIQSLLMNVVVGVQKFRVNQQLVQLSCHPGQIEESRVKVLNAGNLNTRLRLFISEDSGVFSVSPSSLSLAPEMSTEINVVFTPQDTHTRNYQCLLLMQIVPSGDLYEVTLQGKVKEQERPLPKIHTNGSYLHFGGVPLGTTVVKKFELLSKEKKAEMLKLESKSPEVLLVPSKEPSSDGRRIKEMYISPSSMVSVYVAYTPTTMSTLNSTISIIVPNCPKRFKTRVSGYGGVGRLCCDEACLEPVRGTRCPCIALNPSTQAVKDLILTNTGLRPVNVNIDVFSDEECKKPLQSWGILVRPNKVQMQPGQRQKLVVTLAMEEYDFVQACQRSSQGVGAYLGVSYQDNVAVEKPARGVLVVGVTCQFGTAPTSEGLYSLPQSSLQPPAATSHPIMHHNTNTRIDSVSEEQTGRDNTGGWSVKPRHLTLYCCKRGNPQFERMYIYNNNNSDISYEITWPGGMLSLSQDSGIVKGRENTWIHIYPSARAALQFYQLPWTGELKVSCGRQTKVVVVEIKQDTSPVEHTVPEQETLSLVSTSSSHSYQASSSKKMGSLEVSTTVVQFPPTQVEKTSEETIELKNVDAQTLRWMFSSFASPYLKKKSDSRKDIFRVSYKVFDFSRQFGKLNGQSTVVLKLHFMPRSSGTFSQFWDVQTSGNISTGVHNNEYLRIHLTGEAFEPVEEKKKPSMVVDLLKEQHSMTRCKLQHDTLQFHVPKVGKSETMKAQVKNNYLEEVKVEVVGPKPPFYVKHSKFTVDKKRYLRFPVDFHPSRPGRFTDVVKFQVSKGETLVLNLVGECENS